ncbi:hypothetical protein Mgra_00009309 [Meloidogyne graminicola]|uniref:DUF7808 domain-containing protein n=1 Tax=Meloidogyne graminicola TaxID=189291 RepID=A0A8S9Z854_9BILA|nr:hypothetical protein Mgra_00009309 [Meloidogyne graminicola]
MYSILIIPFIFYFISLTNSNEQNIFKNMLIEWKRRTLYCSPSKDGKHSGQCYLTVGKEGTPKLAKCHEESIQLLTGETEGRTSCNIECRGADRDSVISKVPSWNRECIRYFSYDTAREELPKQFGDSPVNGFFWRGGKCRLMEMRKKLQFVLKIKFGYI